MAIFDRFKRTDKAPSVPAGTVQLSSSTVAGMSQNPASATTAEALERNPLDYTVPFSPGRPLIPALINPPREDGRATPRRYEFPVAWNIQITQQRLVPYQLLRDTADQADIVRKCIEVVKSAITGMEWDIALAPEAIERYMADSSDSSHLKASKNAREKLMPEITRAKDFWRMPDRINGLSFQEWIGMAIEEMLVIDALSVYPNQTLDNDTLHSLEIIDGTSIKPLLDDRGARPTPPHAAYQQILWGFPRGEFTASADADGEFSADDLIYAPRNRRTNTPYGYSAVERCLPLVDLYLKRLQWLRTEFSDGVTPDMIIKTDANYGNNPEILRGYEQVFNDALSGNIEQRRRARLLPAGMDPVFSPGWDTKYSSDFDEWLVKAICGHFGVLPSQIGFTPNSGLGGAGHQEGEAASAELLGLRPIVMWLTDLLNQMSYRFLGMPKDLTFILTDGTVTNEQTIATRLQTEVASGLRTFNEARSEMGLPLYSIPEADIPVVIAGATMVQVSQSGAEAAATDPIASPTNATKPENETPPTDKPAAKPVADAEAEAEKMLAKEVKAFIAWTKNTRSRPFQFDYVDDETAEKLSALAAHDAVAAQELARALKAGGLRPKVRGGREPFPTNHPARKASDRLVKIYQEKFVLLGRVNSQIIADQFLANPTHDAFHWLNEKGVRPFGNRGVSLLQDLYSEAGWMGKVAAQALVKQVKNKQKSALSIDDAVWENWTPGHPEAAAGLLDRGLKMEQVWRDAGKEITAIESTMLDRIGNSLNDALERGLSPIEAGRNIADIVGDPARAELIAHTEMAIANAAAATDTYRENGVEMVDWETAGDDGVCEECQGYEQEGPYELAAAPEAPAHPNCGCQLIPAAFDTDGVQEHDMTDGEGGMGDEPAIDAPELVEPEIIETEPGWTREHEAGNWEVVQPNQIDALAEHITQIGRPRRNLDEQGLAIYEKLRVKAVAETAAQLRTTGEGTIFVNGPISVHIREPLSEIGLKRVFDNLDLAKSVGDSAGRFVRVDVVKGLGVNTLGDCTMAQYESYVTQIRLRASNIEASTTLGESPGFKQAPPETLTGVNTIVHEWGHAVDRSELTNQFYQKIEPSNRMYGTWRGKEMGQGLSRYGSKNKYEGYAESFADWAISRGQSSNPATQAYAAKYGWRMP